MTGTRLKRLCASSVMTAAFLIMAGCTSDPNKPYPVRGVIVYEDDGKPVTGLAGGSITFMPANDQGRASSGGIKEDGTFVLSCMREDDGALPGKHRVIIELPEPGLGDVPKKGRPPAKQVIDPASATQEVVVEAKSNQLTLKVKKPPARPSAPAKR
jgi:hypothetical protein